MAPELDDTLPDDADDEVESLVLACLEAHDPVLELEQRTADRPDTRARALRILNRVRAGERSEPAADPTVIGVYRIVRTLGSGGMGTVYLAEQTGDLDRTVALKLVKLGMDTDEVLRRFDLERQALAMMSHNNIARVLDAGRTNRGQPFFVMEYVPGTPLASFADEHALSIVARIELFLQVCAGVQHAHQRGIIHRDLKPANILVIEQDGRGVPKIIDFGLARATEQGVREATRLTTDGAIVGTPAYMSPEQAGATGGEIDTRTDVYALGAILYELLVGQPPFADKELVAAGVYGMLRIIREVEPPRPSARLTRMGTAAGDVARRRETGAVALARALRTDLDWIVMTAIAKDREHRYASVGDLAADVRRYRDHEPVLATAPSTTYRLRKLIRRYRLQVSAAALVLVALVVGLVVSLAFFFDARHAQTETQQAKDRLDPVVLRGLQQEAENDLWPVAEATVPRMEQWIVRAEALQERLPLHRMRLAELAVRLPSNGTAVTLTDPADQALHSEQEGFLRALDKFFADSATPRNVAGVRGRLELARTVRARTVDAHRAAWDSARAAIRAADGEGASRLYSDLELEPQVGLIPLGADPTSKLWEFYHPDSGEPGLALPTRDPASGRFTMRAEFGFVFVLLPGGTFRMGSDRSLDERAEKDELPQHDVTLSPFFLSKFECTQAQWKRLCDGSTPSHYGPGYSLPEGVPGMTWTNPVEQMFWDEAVTACRQWSLQLPTEAHWEYACRASASTIFAWGNDPQGLQRHDNVADSFAGTKALGWPHFEAWSDGHVVHAPVGSFAPNGFGLHDMHGNVMEMCADAELSYEEPCRVGDGLRFSRTPPAGQPAVRIGRGGCWQFDSVYARCSNREEVHVRAASNLVGMRPARSVHSSSR